MTIENGKYGYNHFGPEQIPKYMLEKSILQ